MTDERKPKTSKGTKSVLKQLFSRKSRISFISSEETSPSDKNLSDIAVSRDTSELDSNMKPAVSENEEPNYPLFVGMYEFSSRTDDDLGFKKGDLLYIINTDDDDDWWYARSKHTGQEGYIPSNHVVEFESQLDTEV